jgi:hypothetical protein
MRGNVLWKVVVPQKMGEGDFVLSPKVLKNDSPGRSPR